MLIRVIPVGVIPEKVIEATVNKLRNTFNAKVRVLHQLSVPQETHNHWRKQYEAAKMMEILGKDKEAKFINRDIPTLFITDVDIYYNGLNFVFGLENPTTSSAIVSIARLKPEFYGNSANLYLLTERAAKEAVHEIGHHLGSDHCKHPFCVMSFSPSVNDVDDKKDDFCKSCKIKLAMKGIDVE